MGQNWLSDYGAGFLGLRLLLAHSSGEEEYLCVPTGVWSGNSVVEGQRFAVLVFRDVWCEPAGLWPSGKVGMVLKKEGSGVLLPPGTTLWKDRVAPFGDTGD